MPLTRCERCGKMYNKRGGVKVCTQCHNDEESDYERIRDALEEQPNMTAEQVADSTGVEISCVMRCIESGRVQAITDKIEVRCDRCGAPAISLNKKLCEKCLNELSQQVAREQSRIALPKQREVQLGKALNLEDREEDSHRSARSLNYRKR